MRFKVLSSLLFLLPTLGSTQGARDDASATASLSRERWEAHSIVADGAVNPNDIPYAVKMSAAFRQFAAQQQSLGDVAFRQELRARYAGSDSDRQLISEYASRNSDFLGSVGEQEARGLNEFCVELLGVGAATMGAQAIAARLTENKGRRLALMEAHYRTVVDGLRVGTRSALMREIDTYLVPNITYGTMDYVGLAAEFPDTFQTWTEHNCAKMMQDDGAIGNDIAIKLDDNAGAIENANETPIDILGESD